jgi:single-strand DNA-binding protein
LAEVAEKYVRKGAKLYIEGKIRTRSYDDASGNKRYVTEIYADNMELLDRKPEGQQGSPPPLQTFQSAQPAVSQQQSNPAPSNPVTPFDEGEKDDLPF